MARVDYDKQSEVYDRGRQMPPEGVAAWMASARRRVREDVSRILDLGSGTGRFSAALADMFDAEVVAVEPSSGMRGKAAAKRHPRVHNIGGTAEAIPLGDDSVGLAWLSNVVHHFDDLAQAAHELRRVTARGGTVFVRGAFAGRDYDFSLYRFFPQARQAIDTFPSVPEVIGHFEAAGFATFYTEQVKQVTARSFAELYERAKLRADTTLEALTDEEFERGLELLEEASLIERDPPLDELDLLAVS